MSPGPNEWRVGKHVCVHCGAVRLTSHKLARWDYAKLKIRHFLNIKGPHQNEGLNIIPEPDILCTVCRSAFDNSPPVASPKGSQVTNFDLEDPDFWHEVRPGADNLDFIEFLAASEVAPLPAPLGVCPGLTLTTRCPSSGNLSLSLFPNSTPPEEVSPKSSLGATPWDLFRSFSFSAPRSDGAWDLEDPISPCESLAFSYSSGHPSENVDIVPHESWEGESRMGVVPIKPHEVPDKEPESEHGLIEAASIASQSRRGLTPLLGENLDDSPTEDRDRWIFDPLNKEHGIVLIPDVENWLKGVKFPSAAPKLSLKIPGKSTGISSPSSKDVFASQLTDTRGPSVVEELCIPLSCIMEEDDEDGTPEACHFRCNSPEDHFDGEDEDKENDATMFHLEAIQQVGKEIPDQEEEEVSEESVHDMSGIGTEPEPEPLLSPVDWSSHHFVGPSRPLSEKSATQNAAMIREVRHFFQIPDSVPTRHIPIFYRCHIRIRVSMQTRAYRHGHHVLVSANQSRRAEIDEMCGDIFWKDEAGREVIEPDSDSEYNFCEDAPQGSSSVESLATYQLNEGDERPFNEAVIASEGKGRRLETRTQRPRLQEDHSIHHTVLIRSSLRDEITVVENKEHG